MQDYFDNRYEAIKEFVQYTKENTMPEGINTKPKPLYMLIKVDVDADKVDTVGKAHTYAQNHCDKLEYELVDYHYPTKYSEREHPFIKL